MLWKDAMTWTSPSLVTNAPVAGCATCCAQQWHACCSMKKACRNNIDDNIPSKMLTHMQAFLPQAMLILRWHLAAETHVAAGASLAPDILKSCPPDGRDPRQRRLQAFMHRLGDLKEVGHIFLWGAD